MAYYLSKQNEIFLQEFLPVLKNATENVTLETNDPDRLIYIIRNASSLDKYSWLGKKFIFSRKPIIQQERIIPGVLCKIRNVVVNVVDGINIMDGRVDLVEIVNYLINNKPGGIRFSNAYLTESEYERLLAYTEANNYSLKQDPNNGITILRK